MVFDAEAWGHLHDVVDGEGVEEAEEDAWEQGQKGDEVPDSFVAFLLLLLLPKKSRQVQLDLIVDIQNDKENEPEVPEQTENSVRSIDEL